MTIKSEFLAQEVRNLLRSRKIDLEDAIRQIAEQHNYSPATIYIYYYRHTPYNERKKLYVHSQTRTSKKREVWMKEMEQLILEGAELLEAAAHVAKKYGKSEYYTQNEYYRSGYYRPGARHLKVMNPNENDEQMIAEYIKNLIRNGIKAPKVWDRMEKELVSKYKWEYLRSMYQKYVLLPEKENMNNAVEKMLELSKNMLMTEAAKLAAKEYGVSIRAVYAHRPPKNEKDRKKPITSEERVKIHDEMQELINSGMNKRAACTILTKKYDMKREYIYDAYRSYSGKYISPELAKKMDEISELIEKQRMTITKAAGIVADKYSCSPLYLANAYSFCKNHGQLQQI